MSTKCANVKAKVKGKIVASVTLLEKFEPNDGTHFQLHSITHSVQRHDSDMDNNISIDYDCDVGESIVTST